MKFNARIALIATGALSCFSALADCGPVIDAMEKSAKQPRVATFEVASPAQAPVGAPRSVRFDGAYYERDASGSYARSEAGAKNPLTTGAMTKKLRDAEASGSTRCTALGAADLRGTAVLKYGFDNPFMPPMPASAQGDTKIAALPQMRRMVVWIDKSSGVLLYSEIGNILSAAYVYGDAVKLPSPLRGQK